MNIARIAGKGEFGAHLVIAAPGKVAEQAVEIRNLQDQNDNYQPVQNRFDLNLHGNDSVNDPQQKPYCNNREDDGGKWDIVFSNRFL